MSKTKDEKFLSISKKSLALILFLLCATATECFGFDYIKGSWGLTDTISEPIPSGMLNNPGLVGIIVTINWKEIEKSEDFYDSAALGKLDARIAEISSANKKIAFRIYVNSSKAPQWLKDKPGVTNITLLDTLKYRKKTFCTNITGPVFWDPTYVAEGKEFISYLGSRYTNNPALVAVFFGVANWYFEEMSVLHYVGDI